MSAFKARFEATELAPTETGVRVRLRVRNESSRPWPAAGPVFMSWQVLDEAGEMLLAEGERVPLGRDLPPGEEAEVTLEVELPPEAGAYRVLLSPVEEPVAWFYERGGDCLLLRAEVTAQGVGAVSQSRLTAAQRRWETARRRIRRLLVAPFSTLLRYRSLMAAMVRRDIHGRYRGSMAGMFWTIIHPVLLMATYFFVFAVVLKVRFGPGPAEEGPVNFLLYFICGMMPWLAMSEALGRAPSVVMEHRSLVTRVLFPVEILPANVAISGLVTQFFVTIVFIAGLLIVQHGIAPTAAYFPAVLIPQVLLTVGLCWFLAALGVFLRDTGQFMMFLLTLLFFATPICYPESALPESSRRIFELNPLYIIVRAYRAMFLERSAPDWSQVALLWAGAIVVFLLGFGWFYKSRKAFADVL